VDKFHEQTNIFTTVEQKKAWLENKNIV
jgi:hypothetical protein